MNIEFCSLTFEILWKFSNKLTFYANLMFCQMMRDSFLLIMSQKKFHSTFVCLHEMRN